MMTFNPSDWFWVVGGDDSRWWSSSVGAYIDALPDGAGVTRILNEQELTDALSAYGLPGPIVVLPDLKPYQFRAMLKISGKEADLLTFMDGLPEPAQSISKAKLDYSLEVRRDNDLVEAARQAMGLTVEQLDALWLQAAAIV